MLINLTGINGLNASQNHAAFFIYFIIRSYVKLCFIILRLLSINISVVMSHGVPCAAGTGVAGGGAG